MLADRRLWRTADGRLVEDGDEAALVLAYAFEDVIAPEDEDKIGKKAEKPRARKAAEKPRP